jgi:C4-type Zn-finger protein
VPNEEVGVDEEPKVQEEFSCPLCGRVFSNKHSIPLHMSTMHATAIYCRRCCRTFDTYEQLLVHDNLKACTAIDGPDQRGVRKSNINVNKLLQQLNSSGFLSRQ